MADYYKVLGVSKNAGSEEIKRAFRELAQKYHPDKPGGDAEKFKEVNEAYQVLSDLEKEKCTTSTAKGLNKPGRAADLAVLRAFEILPVTPKQ